MGLGHMHSRTPQFGRYSQPPPPHTSHRAATSLLFSALTFALVVALGGGAALTPAVAFTSLALFGLLTGPLNAFPWVVNGACVRVCGFEGLCAGLRV